MHIDRDINFFQINRNYQNFQPHTSTYRILKPIWIINIYIIYVQ